MAPKRRATVAEKTKGKAARGGKNGGPVGVTNKADKGGTRAAEALGKMVTEFVARMGAAREAEEAAMAAILSGVEEAVTLLGEEETKAGGGDAAALVAMLGRIYGRTREVATSLVKKGVVFAKPRAGSRYGFVQRWMPHVFDTDDEEYKGHALVSLISMTWVRQHLGHGPFGPQKGNTLPQFVFVEQFFFDSKNPVPYKAWVNHTLSLLGKQQVSLFTRMLDNRAAQIYAAIGQVLSAVTRLELSDEDKNNIAAIADEVTAFSNELWKSPTTWRLVPMGLLLNEKDDCPAMKEETHELLDAEEGMEISNGLSMHGVVFPGLSEITRAGDGKLRTIAKAKVKVICTEPEGREVGVDENEEPEAAPEPNPAKTSEQKEAPVAVDGQSKESSVVPGVEGEDEDAS